MAEVNEQDGVSNCPIFNELDNKLANSEINEVVHIELPNLEHTEQLEDVTQEDSEVSTSSGGVTRVKQETPLPLGTDLLTAFQHGLEQTVALVQHMSREEQNQAWHTLQGLVVDKSLLPAEDSAVSTDKSLEYCQDAASSTNPTESSTNPTESSTNPTESSTNPTESSTNPTESSTNPTESSTNPTESSTNPTESSTNPTESSTNPTESSPSEECAEKDMVQSTNVTRTVTHRPVTRSTTQAPIVKQEKSDDMSTVKPKRKRGRPRKTPLENAPASVPHPGDVTSNMMSTRGRKKRQLSKHNENENNKIVEPTSNNDDPNDKEDREDEGNEGKEELRIKEENMIHLGGDDAERKMIYAAVEKTSGGWLCTVCGKLSSAKHNLLVHLRIHTGERPYSCKLCLKKFSVVSNLQRHTKDVHSGYQPFLCNRCDASFHNKRALNKHTRSQHADSVGKMYQCAECGKAFKVLAVLEAHMVLHSGDQPFVCSQCSRSFTFRTNLLRHMKIHTGDRPHKCKECGKGFIEKKSLVLHVDRQHLGIKPSDQGHCFTCSTCSKTFSNRANLHTHNFVHTGLKPHACPVCGKMFSLSSNMRRHLLTHSGEKPWECTDCHKCFTEKRSLEVHRRLHTGERPYACEICGKTFMQPGTLQSHMPVHSKTRAFTCDKCGKSFLRKSHMNFHMKKHKVAPPFACVFCNKRFYRKSDIDRHLLKHTNEKPYACQLCPKRFSRLQYLKEHGNMHTGARPYKCQQCDMAFADMSSCYKHRRTHTWQATGYADKPDATPTSTRSSPMNHVNIAQKQSSMSVSTVDLQNLKAVENIISLANVQMIFSSGKEQIVDGTCITPATSTEISDLDNIVYETLLPNDQLKVLTNETMPCKDSPDNAAVFKDLSPEQATQLRLALARGISLEVSDPSSAFTVSDSDLETVFIQEGCDKSTEGSVTMSQGQFTDTIPCSKVVSADNTETVTEATTDDVAMEKLADSVSMETAGDIIGKLYPEPMCGANETVGSTTAGPTGVTNLVESVSVDNGVTLSPVQLVGSASTQQYYLVLSGSGQEAMPVE